MLQGASFVLDGYAERARRPVVHARPLAAIGDAHPEPRFFIQVTPDRIHTLLLELHP